MPQCQNNALILKINNYFLWPLKEQIVFLSIVKRDAIEKNNNNKEITGYRRW